MGKYSYSEILNERVLSRLMALENNESQICWDIGDEINLVVEYAGASEGKYTIGDVCKAFGVVLGMRAKDLRVMALVASSFPYGVRDKHNVLTWGHFLRAMGPDWEGHLEWMEAGVDQLGRPASVDAFLASGKGKDRVDEHPAEIAKGNARERAVRILGDVSKAIGSGKIDLDPERADKVWRLLQDILVLLQ